MPDPSFQKKASKKKTFPVTGNEKIKSDDTGKLSQNFTKVVAMHPFGDRDPFTKFRV